MQDIIDALEIAAQDQITAIDRPEEDEITEIEEQILLPIPYEFKQFLLNVSHLVVGSLEPVTVTDPNAHTHLPEMTAEAWAIGLPRDVIPLCQKLSGYYCVNQDDEVLFWLDGHYEDEQYENAWQWAEEVWLRS